MPTPAVVRPRTMQPEDVAKKRAPRFPTAPLIGDVSCCRCLVREDRLARLRLDGDCPGLLLFRDLTHQLDGEQAVGELRTRDLHVVGELEAALEVAAGDAAV